MPQVFRKSVVRYKDPEGRQVPKGTPGARKVKEKSAKWYGRPPGAARPVPLCANKTAAQQMLNQLAAKAGLAQVGLGDPFEAHKKRPLAEHLADFEAALLAKGDTPKQAAQVAARARKVLDACGFVFMADLSASRVMEHLAALRGAGRPLPPPGPGKESFTKAELARALGISPAAVGPLIRRHGLEATGQGKARRYPRGTAEALRHLRTRGRSVQTSNFYLQAVKQFCRWLVSDRRMGDSPLAHLAGGNVRTDRRHDRRELAEGELRSLLAVTRGSGRTFRGLAGEDRFHLYACACATGFRASALASLTPESFDLAGDPPTVTLAAREHKNRKLKVQPLPPDVADLLRAYLEGKPAGRPLWGGTWASDNKGAEMLRGDLEAAGIPYAVEGPDGPLYADFHALRHTYLTLGGRAGIDLRTLQELAGHHSPTLTARYSHRRLYDLAGAVEKLPNFLPPEAPAAPASALRATGTDASAAVDFSCPPVAQAADGGCGPLRVVDAGGGGDAGGGNAETPVPDRGLRADEGGCEWLRGLHLAGLEPATFGSVDGMRRRTSSQVESTSGVVEGSVARQLPGGAGNGPEADPSLARVVAAWPGLPEHARLTILAIIDAARG